MAKLVLTDAAVTIGGTDLSDHVRQVTITYSAETKDVTAMGTAGTREKLGGLKDWSLQIEFLQDWAAANVDATMFPLVGTTFAVEVKPTSGATSATNPAYQGTGLLTSYQPLGATVGDEATAPVTIEGSGTLTRATA